MNVLRNALNIYKNDSIELIRLSDLFPPAHHVMSL